MNALPRKQPNRGDDEGNREAATRQAVTERDETVARRLPKPHILGEGRTEYVDPS
jgi:hypothetical protein